MDNLELLNADPSLSQPNLAPLSTWLHHYQKTIDWLSAPRYQLDQQFVQLTLLVDRGPATLDIRFVPDGQQKRYDNLVTLLQESKERVFVLLGRPGSGKTTLLHHLHLEHTRQSLISPAGQVIFFAPLNLYRSEQPGKPPPEPLAWLAQEWAIRYPYLPSFTTAFHQGQCLLLLDGLNEIPHHDKTDYQERISQWQVFLQRYQHLPNTLLFSCRNLDYSAFLSSEAAPVRQVQIEPLSPAQIQAYLTQHLAERGQPIWAALQGDPKRLQLFSTPFFLKLLVEQIVDTGKMPTGQAGLLTGFVRRALRRELEHKHRLFKPGLLLSVEDTQQVNQDIWATPYDLPADGPLIPKLAELAFEMQTGQDGAERGQVHIAETDAQTLLAHPQAQEITEAGIQLNILDKDLATRTIMFYHQLLQEYFAARLLAQNPDPQRVWQPWQADAAKPTLAETVAGLAVSEPLQGLPSTGWEETTVLATAMDRYQNTAVRQLMTTNLPLAARCAASPEVKLAPALIQQIQQALLERIANPQADLRACITAAEALGDLGDPRFVRRQGPFGAYLQPPLVAVAGGNYRIGDDDSQYSSEKPAHEVPITPFEMGMFPVTNAEYRLFMEAGGYEEERWWQTEAARGWRKGEGSNEGAKKQYQDWVNLLAGVSEEAIQQQPNFTPEQIETYLWLKKASPEEVNRQLDEWYPSGKVYWQPEFWENGRFNHPARPVVGITWFEACAYCAWLSAQTGHVYSLPTEAQWEAAARGLQGRVYAYGNTYEAAHCNTFETHIRRTTPVGVFPGGCTPEGIADLSGNVWEWTTTLWGEELNQPTFRYPYNASDGREDPTNGTARRVVRGGSWDPSRVSARAASRFYDNPDFRLVNLGFRVVLVVGGGLSPILLSTVHCSPAGVAVA